MSNRAVTVGLFLATAGLAGAASATVTESPNSTEPARSVTVRYHEEDLATGHGAQRLFGDLERAARDVCDDTGEYVLAHSFAGCEQSALAGAVAQVDNAKLTTVYNGHFPNDPLTAALSLRLQPTIIVVAG